MNWFEMLLPSKIRTSGANDKKNVPEGLWAKCNSCDAIIYRAELERNQEVCTKCEGARRRLQSFFDEDSYSEIAAELEAEDVLKFKDDKRYRDRLSQAQKQTGEKDALIAMRGHVKGVEMVAVAFEFQFMGGSRWDRWSERSLCAR
jgi:acetyl-CoA carboxylase carboxyl transferase subunit beta